MVQQPDWRQLHMGSTLREAGRPAEGLVWRQAQRRGGAPQAHHARRAGQAGQVACAARGQCRILTSTCFERADGRSWRQLELWRCLSKAQRRMLRPNGPAGQ